MEISLRNLRKTFPDGGGERTAFEAVHLELGENRFAAVLGSSGSGKTALFSLLALLDYPTSGSLWIGGEDLSMQDERIRERFRLERIGLWFRHPGLLPSLSVLENVTLPMLLLGKYAGMERPRAQSLLDLVGMSLKEEERPDRLTFSEKARVALARALANQPRLLLADEPTAFLEMRAGRLLMELLRGVQESLSITVVLFTQDPRLAAYAEEIYTLDAGRLEGAAL